MIIIALLSLVQLILCSLSFFAVTVVILRYHYCCCCAYCIVVVTTVVVVDDVSGMRHQRSLLTPAAIPTTDLRRSGKWSH